MPHALRSPHSISLQANTCREVLRSKQYCERSMAAHCNVQKNELHDISCMWRAPVLHPVSFLYSSVFRCKAELGAFHNSLAVRSCSQHFASSKHLQRRSKFNCTRGDLIIRLHCYHAHSSSLQANTCNDVLRSLHSHLSAATLPSNVSIV